MKFLQDQRTVRKMAIRNNDLKTIKTLEKTVAQKMKRYASSMKDSRSMPEQSISGDRSKRKLETSSGDNQDIKRLAWRRI